MDEVIRDLVVIGLIALVLFAGVVEYVYWRLGFDRIVKAMESSAEASWFTAQKMDEWARERNSRRAA